MSLGKEEQGRLQDNTQLGLYFFQIPFSRMMVSQACFVLHHLNLFLSYNSKCELPIVASATCFAIKTR